MTQHDRDRLHAEQQARQRQLLREALSHPHATGAPARQQQPGESDPGESRLHEQQQSQQQG